MSSILSLFHRKMSNTQATLMILLAAIIWSTSGLCIKLLDWHPVVIAGGRSFLATFLTYCVIENKKAIRLTPMVAIQAVVIALTYITFICANKLTTSANAIMLQYTSPIWTMLFSAVFLKTRIRRRDLIAVACAFAGIILFFFDNLSLGNMLGNLIAIFSGMLQAVSNVYYSSSKTDTTPTVFFGHICTFLIAVPFLFIQPPTFGSAAEIGVWLYLGTIQIGVATVLYSKGMNHCSPLNGSLVSMIEPIINPVWVLLVVGEIPGLFAIIGSVVVLLSIGIWCVKNARDAAKEAPPAPAPEPAPVAKE